MVKLTKRKGFNFFRSYYDVYNELEDADKVKFMDALLDRQFLGVKPTELIGMSKFAYISQTNSIDSQVKGFEDKTGIKLSPPCVGGSVGVVLPPTVQVEEKGEVQVEEKGEEKVKITIPKKTEKVFSEEIINCFNKCLKYFPEQLRPKTVNITNNWLETIEKLNRLDKIPFEKIVEIVKNTREDDFWSKNFMSLVKLRNKKDGVPYVVIFNEKFSSNGNTNFEEFAKESYAKAKADPNNIRNTWNQ